MEAQNEWYDVRDLYVVRGEGFERSHGGDAPTLGRCRRRAPTMNGYPVVYMTDWCGDHKLDESKVRADPSKDSVDKDDSETVPCV